MDQAKRKYAYNWSLRQTNVARKNRQQKKYRPMRKKWGKKFFKENSRQNEKNDRPRQKKDSKE